MLFSESVSVALFLIAIVFFVLVCLYLCIKLFSFLIEKIKRTQN